MDSAAEQDRPVILFDGVCNLCTGSVRFVIERDSRKKFCFAPLQSPIARELLRTRGWDPDILESMLLVLDGRVHRKSTAALQIARRLDGPWPLLYGLIVVPRPLRDALYDWVGTRRYRWFGRRESCWTPPYDLADRFLD